MSTQDIIHPPRVWPQAPQEDPSRRLTLLFQAAQSLGLRPRVVPAPEDDSPLRQRIQRALCKSHSRIP